MFVAIMQTIRWVYTDPLVRVVIDIYVYVPGPDVLMLLGSTPCRYPLNKFYTWFNLL